MWDQCYANFSFLQWGRESWCKTSFLFFIITCHSFLLITTCIYVFFLWLYLDKGTEFYCIRKSTYFSSSVTDSVIHSLHMSNLESSTQGSCLLNTQRCMRALSASANVVKQAQRVQAPTIRHTGTQTYTQTDKVLQSCSLLDCDSNDRHLVSLF